MLPSMFEEITGTCSQDHMALLRGLHSMPVSGAPTLEDIFQWAASAGIPYFDCSGATEMAGPILIRHAWDSPQRNTGLQVLPGLMGLLKKIRETDLHGELVIRGTVSFTTSSMSSHELNKETSTYQKDMSPAEVPPCFTTKPLGSLHISLVIFIATRKGVQFLAIYKMKRSPHTT